MEHQVGGDLPSPLGVAQVLEKSWQPHPGGFEGWRGGSSDSQRVEKTGPGLGRDGVAVNRAGQMLKW